MVELWTVPGYDVIIGSSDFDSFDDAESTVRRNRTGGFE